MGDIVNIIMMVKMESSKTKKMLWKVLLFVPYASLASRQAQLEETAAPSGVNALFKNE